ncbi:hypothetical protein M433DRAFT_135173 [Acidomyces richmondensis BFW]|nr:hypothetical protein M433DRAFT_135173 [Acidomyces richmondensis BFW]
MDADIDPAIAEAMGFTGFGTQPQQKRKFNVTDALIDQHTGNCHEMANLPTQRNDANNLHLGKKKSRTKPGVEWEKGYANSNSSTTEAEGAEKNEVKNDLQIFKNGVKNERGDMVYFMPDFIEDPWKSLDPR